MAATFLFCELACLVSKHNFTYSSSRVLTKDLKASSLHLNQRMTCKNSLHIFPILEMFPIFGTYSLTLSYDTSYIGAGNMRSLEFCAAAKRKCGTE